MESELENISGGTPKIIQLIRQAQGLAPTPEEESILQKLTPHVPGIVTFANHSRSLPWSTVYTSVLVFADVSGFTALCERYSTMKNAGIDQLTKTLNDYLGAIVEGIISSEGDVLKFAGDAILAVWRVNTPEELPITVDKVIKCCVSIQKQCGEWKTDIGVVLTVKMGVASGDMTVTFLGNNEFRVYVELGEAVTEVNTAEHFCKSGYIVLSPRTWSLCDPSLYNYEFLEDNQHIRILPCRSSSRADKSRSAESTSENANWYAKRRVTSAGWGVTVTKLSAASAFAAAGNLVFPDKVDPVSETSSTSGRRKSLPSSTQPPSIPEEKGPKELQAPIPAKKRGLSMLRNVVRTVKEMRLDEYLRLYILLPVLKKLDDNQPLEYLSEMRQVSIEFINLILDDTYDSTKLLQQISEIVYSQAKVMHGCLNKVFLFDKGCTFLVIFGLPGYKHERDAAHALICSQKLKKALSDVNGVMRVSIGVTTGTTFCGVVGHKNRHEYSVIGRKVNMAARLMMHYPDKVTCDENTYNLSRLPQNNFVVLITKSMKGLRNIGIIREYTESADVKSNIATIPHFKYPILGRELEIELFTVEMQKLLQFSSSEIVNHFMFIGASGIGKTRLMDHLINLAEKSDIQVVSCALKIEDSHTLHFLTRHVVHMLLSSAGFSHHVDKEPEILECLSSAGLAMQLHVVNSVIGTKFPKAEGDIELGTESSYIQKILNCIVAKCLEKSHCAILVAVDDAHNIDEESWKFLCNLLTVSGILIIQSSRPAAIENPICKASFTFIESSNVRVHDMGNLHLKHTPALACQIMSVMRIPKDLDQMLRDRAQGVPYWCEQLLVDMVQKKQLLINLNDQSSEAIENTVAPQEDEITPVDLDPEKRDSEESITETYTSNPVFKSEEMTTDPNKNTATNFLESLKYTQKSKRRPARNLERVAIFSPSIDPHDVPIPASMKELINARLDSMRASEQLIVKCAAILGTEFPRDMIETILPQVQRVKARKCFKRLMQIGIFECARLPVTEDSSQGINVDTTMCLCPKGETVFDNDLCSLMRFKNKLLQQTAYEILMENQRQELHRKAAEYLEREADKIKKHIPYYLLNKDPPVEMQEKLVQISEVLVQRENGHRSSKGNRVHSSDYRFRTSRQGRRRAISVAVEDIDPLIQAVLKLDGTQEKLEELVRHLFPLYVDIQHHLKLAKQEDRLVSCLLEAASAQLFVKNPQKASSLIDELDEMLEKLSNDDVVLKSKVFRLRSKVEIQNDHHDKALKYLKKSASLMEIKQPTSKVFMWLKFIRCSLHLWSRRKSQVPHRPATLRTLEQGNCLADLFWLYLQTNQMRAAKITAMQQMIKITGRACHLHQIIQAYLSAIQVLKASHSKLKSMLERELFASCISQNEELFHYDLGHLAVLYTGLAESYLDSGDIMKSLNSGTGAFEISDTVNDIDIAFNVAPYCAMSFILDCRNNEVSAFIKKFETKALSTERRIPKAWLYAFCVERLLNGDFPLQSFQCCLDFAASYMKSCDAVQNEFLPRYFLAMTISVWFCRKGQWEKAQPWLDYWEMYEPSMTSFLSLYALSRKVEAMLLSFRVQQNTKLHLIFKKFQKSIKKDLKQLETCCITTKGIRPRFHHLKAYYHILNERKFMSKYHLRIAHSISLSQGNNLEKNWVNHHLSTWFLRQVADKKLTTMTTSDTNDNQMSTTGVKYQHFTWPIRRVLF